ncbi:Asp-tRNA(Asn)/Glu-tRNA(Gln) amidotransferase subunit GatC [Traorella massiliensis]|uniref:Asp-tRNA(Asn)/Glu-tRNA(Gln) amidotransferase subunit GatC n=1 Tax=Traorella massiliensis TaxID=1903263 RepID=UPI0008F87040|nr:Asp-tRNA(Asn)/Glu-tRNA(Gln) amidotransferase subunit GatC [Traorella massiliensis]
MEKFSKEMLRKLANQVMFDLNDQECEELQEEFETYLKQLDLLNKIDTENVEEMVYPFDTPTSFIRNDDEVYAISQEDAMKNVPQASENYVVVPKVVK